MPGLSQSEVSAMAAAHAAHLGHTCVIQRFTSSGVDALNQPTPGTWATIYSGACHYFEAVEREVVGTTNVVLTDARLALPAGTDVTAADRVLSVVDGAGTTLVANLDIRGVMVRGDGVDAVLEHQT